MFMPKTLVVIGIVVGIVIIGIGVSYAVCINACQGSTQNMMNSMMSSVMGGNMMSGMMNDSPQDVIIKVVSSQQVPIGKEVEVKLLVLDKNTKQQINNAQVIIGIEKGAPMSTMNMVTPMFEATNMGNGKYVASFTVDDSGYYTMHTHVILSGKSMHSMMQNHMDIGILAK